MQKFIVYYLMIAPFDTFINIQLPSEQRCDSL